MKNKLQDYTEEEFYALLERSEEIDFPEKELDELVVFFNTEVAHPKGSDLIMTPTALGIEDSPEAIINEIKRWYKDNGLPLFKSE